MKMLVKVKDYYTNLDEFDKAKLHKRIITCIAIMLLIFAKQGLFGDFIRTIVEVLLPIAIIVIIPFMSISIYDIL